ncbi:2Fe-2S iron-sulfur cluster-binding protein [Nocardioides solisilvae]|uniref:2Fe-2S iron-sulfur cluster-binding protein n=1 Tax=Nocardioides solisilvae TaxID=1542435 RepID=UPI00194FFE43|nr:2Fe-2S iron-sulfur cluster-binding protein [Nocardioides solisilvae]
MRGELLEVAGVRPLTDDALEISFALPPRLHEAWRYRAGQHLTLVGADGARRSFSLCSPPSAREWRIGVRRLPGGAFSDDVAPRLAPGDVLEVLPPSGRFSVEADPTRRASYVAVAGGSGITPLLAIVGTLLEEEPGSCVTLVRADRSSGSVMFLDEVLDLKDRFPTRLQLVHVLSREQQESPLLTGRLDAPRFEALLAALVDRERVDEWFLCGPQGMVESLRAHLVAGGATRVHTELFHAEPVAPAPPAGPDAARRTEDAGEGARVTVRLDGRTTDLVVARGGPPVLEAVAGVRQDVPWACRGGVCGTCRARVVEGEAVMDLNYALEPDEVARGYVLTCQAHPVGPRLVLDYDA